MKRASLCELLGIRYPIIQAPMAWVATAELAAAVSEAGGLGTPVGREGTFDGDETGSALGTGGVGIDTLFSDEPVLVGAAGGGTGTADSVLNLQRSQFDGRE